MSLLTKILLGITGAIFIAVFLLNTTTPVGKPLPEFTLQTTDNQTLTNADLKGKPTLIYLFGDPCPACNVARPSIKKAAKENNLTVIAAEVWNDSPEQAKRMKEEQDTPFTYVSGGTKLSDELEIQAVPTLLVIDKNGKVIDMHVGFGTEKDVLDAAQKLAKS